MQAVFAEEVGSPANTACIQLCLLCGSETPGLSLFLRSKIDQVFRLKRRIDGIVLFCAHDADKSGIHRAFSNFHLDRCWYGCNSDTFLVKMANFARRSALCAIPGLGLW